MPLGDRTRLLRRTARGRRPPSWMSPALAPHQELDAGIAARAQADRKNLKKARTPFATYFKTVFTRSSFSRPVTRPDGRMFSAYGMTRMMSNPQLEWESPWGRPHGAVRVRRKRQDALERPAQSFGDDAIDGVLNRLVDVRFEWDKADGILVNSLVPSQLHRFTAHAAPFALMLQHDEADGMQHLDGGDNTHSGGTETLTVQRACASASRGRPVDKATACADLQRRLSEMTQRNGFTGVNSIPAIVLDAARGPLVSSPTEDLLAWRWSSTSRDAASVSTVLREKQRISAMTLIAVPPASLLLLLKVLATFEIDDPATETALVIAAGEHYYHYTRVQQLEVLRCLRRVGMVRMSRQLGTSAAPTSLQELYRDPTVAQAALGQYVLHDAPFLTTKVWSSMPEHVQHLRHRRYYLDLIDYMGLAMEVAGERMPSNLPNPATKAPYAAKAFFLLHTLGFDVAFMCELVSALCPSAATELASVAATQTTGVMQKVVGDEAGVLVPTRSSGSFRAAGADEDSEGGLQEVLWLCASVWIRLVAESLGAVLRHVEHSLREHGRMAEELAARGLGPLASRSKHERERLRAAARAREEAEVERLLTQVSPSRPFHRVYQSIGRRRPRLMRLRLLPFDAFPDLARLLVPPFAKEVRAVSSSARDSCSSLRKRAALRGAVLDHGDSHTLASVLSMSELLAVHVERACSTLAWASGLLRCWAVVLRVSDAAAAHASPSSTSPVLVQGDAPCHGCASATTAQERRAILGRLHVQVRVQHSMDCLFTHIPWLEIQDRLRLDTRATAAEPPVADPAGSEASGECPTLDHGVFLQLLDDGTESEGALTPPSTTTPVEVTESEECRRARELLQRLQQHIEVFQATVADLVDAQEAFFPEAPAAAASAAAPPA